MPILALKLQLTSGQFELTQDSSVGAGNAVLLKFLVSRLAGGGTFTCVLQGSLDRLNWFDLQTTSNIGLGFSTSSLATGVGVPYIRAKIASPALTSGQVTIGAYPTKQ